MELAATVLEIEWTLTMRSHHLTILTIHIFHCNIFIVTFFIVTYYTFLHEVDQACILLSHLV
jgi:hypothetical protein